MTIADSRMYTEVKDQNTGRDYLDEVAREVSEYMENHDHVISAEAANELISRWETGDPDLLAGWLRARAHQILRDYVYAVSLSRGARRPREEQFGRFASFREGFHQALEEGAEKGREYYRYHSVTEGPLLVRKPLSDLTARQVNEVGERYKKAAEDNTFMARVLEAVAVKVSKAGPEATVADVYTPAQLEKMFDR